MANRYVSSVDYAALTAWAATTAYVIGNIRRQLAAQTLGNGRVFRCTTAGTSGAAEPAWALTAGATTTDGTVVWTEVTSNATYNAAAWATAPFDSLMSAINLAAAGDTYYVAHTHSETGAANTNSIYSFKGNVPNSAPPNLDRILCVNRAGTFPPVAADLTTGAASASNGSGFLMTLGSFYCYGVKLTAGSGANSANLRIGDDGGAYIQLLENCQFVLGGTNGGSNSVGRTVCVIKLLNCTWVFNNASQSIQACGSPVLIDGPSTTTLISSASTVFPTALLGSGGQDNIHGNIIRNADLSNLPNGSYVALGNNGGGRPAVQLINCKLPAVGAVFGYTGGTNPLITPLEVTGCNSAANVERNEKHMYVCNQTTETTIVRTGGASDGTTAYSWKLVPQNSANSVLFPFESFEGAIWNDITGSAKTLTIHCVTDNITLNNNDLWLEVDYLGTAGAPLATHLSTFPATILTAPAAIATDTAAWTTTGLTTPVKQQLQLTFTPQLKGPIRWRLRYAHASATVYVCPKADLA